MSNRFGYIVATPVMCAADKKKTDREFASVAMARELYNGRLPHEAVTAEAVCVRLDKVFDARRQGTRKLLWGSTVAHNCCRGMVNW